MKTIKIISIALIGIWFSGAALMVATYEIERKNECIDREGLIKGVFWCETDPISNSEITTHINFSLLKGLGWPYELFVKVMDGKINHYFSNGGLDIPDEYRDYYYNIPREFRIPEEFVNQSYDYIKNTEYGENWISTENNKYKLWLPLTGEFGFKRYFKLGSGECEKYLAEMNAQRISLLMKSVNYQMRSEPDENNNIPIRYTKLQCIAYEGVDQECEKRLNIIADEIMESSDETSLGKEELSLLIMRLKIFKINKSCEISKEIGQERIISLRDPNELK